MFSRHSEVVLAVLASLLVASVLYRQSGGPLSADSKSLPTPAEFQPAGHTRVTLKSAKDDWIGGGRDWSFTSDNASFQFLGAHPENGVILKVHTRDGEDLELSFGAPQKQLLRVGRYEGATRHFVSFDKPLKPGLDVSGWHRGSNKLSGSFEVLDVAYGPEGATRFAADFVQYGEEMASRRLEGSVRYQSVVP